MNREDIGLQNLSWLDPLPDWLAQAPLRHERGWLCWQFGRAPLSDIVALQQQWVNRLITQPQWPNLLLLGEHPPVYTVGRGVRESVAALHNGLPVVPLSRGGQWTYHGPGQVMIYPIARLKPGQLRPYVVWLQTLPGRLLPPLRPFAVAWNEGVDLPVGTWLHPPAACQGQTPQKVASIGVVCQRNVVWQGMAVTIIEEGLTGFSHIQPCGLQPNRMAALAHWLPELTVAEFLRMVVG